jgi:hypothetical protein
MKEFRKDFRRISKSVDALHTRIRKANPDAKKGLDHFMPFEALNDRLLAKIEACMTSDERQDPLAVDSRRAEEIAALACCSLEVMRECLDVYVFIRDWRQDYQSLVRRDWLEECGAHFLIWGALLCIVLLLILAILMLISN